MKQRLGPKKLRRIERLTGMKVSVAFVRGGWPHGWAEVFFKDAKYTMEQPPPFVNYKTGEINMEGNPFTGTMRGLIKQMEPDTLEKDIPVIHEAEK